jgi:hypothetical protein
MTYPTEMTLTTGTTVYAGDPDSGERIVSREVRVSITYQVDDEMTNLVGLAFAKAAEVERARLAACERIARDQADPYEPALDLIDPSLEPPDEDAPDPFPDEADYLSARCGPAPIGGCPGNGDHARNGCSAYPPASPAGTEQVTEETDWATKPQVLALGSHFKRLGLSPENQSALLRARYGKFRPERLTKEEAAGLMRCLERGEWEPMETAIAP